MNKGTYCLLMHLDREKTIPVGRKQTKFRQGYYIYVGSALGNLNSRLRRHLSEKKKLKWHIDYLLQHAKIIDISTIRSSKKLECNVNSLIRASGGEPVRGFGSSDCKCDAHLHYFPVRPNIRIRVNV